MKTPISLALSGGGMRGCAHIGVFKRIEELPLDIKEVAGTSIGAIVGAFIADGFSSKEIEEIFITSEFSFDLNYFKFTEAILSSEKMKRLLETNLRSKTFEQLKLPFHVCVTNFKTGKAEYIASGNLVKAILASAAIPVIYKPVKIGTNTYVDGGLSNNLPAEILNGKKFPIIGVHVNPLSLKHKEKSLFQKLDYSIHLSLLEKLEEAKKYCAVFIEPEKLTEFSLFETDHIQKLIKIGYDSAVKTMNQNALNTMH